MLWRWPETPLRRFTFASTTADLRCGAARRKHGLGPRLGPGLGRAGVLCPGPACTSCQTGIGGRQVVAKRWHSGQCMPNVAWPLRFGGFCRLLARRMQGPRGGPVGLAPRGRPVGQESGAGSAGAGSSGAAPPGASSSGGRLLRGRSARPGRPAGQACGRQRARCSVLCSKPLLATAAINAPTARYGPNGSVVLPAARTPLRTASTIATSTCARRARKSAVTAA